MSLADIVSSMQQIQAQLALLQGAAPPSTASSAANASAFAGALGEATAASDVTGSTTAPLPSGSVTGKDVVKDALKYVGTPYVFGGESKSGMDCSGLVQRAFADLGVKVPRTVTEQRKIGQPVASLKDAKPGDLVVTDGGNHISIWMGNNTVIHAPYEGRTVSVQKAWFTDKDVLAIRRVVPSEAAAPARTVQAAPLGGSSGAAPGASLSSLLSALGASGTASTSTTQQLLAARAALLQGAA